MNERDLEDLEGGRRCAARSGIENQSTPPLKHYWSQDVYSEAERDRLVVAEADRIMRAAVIELFNVVEDFVNASREDDADMLLTDAKVKLARWSPLVRMLIEKRKLWGLT